MQDDLLISKREILAILFRRIRGMVVIFSGCVVTAAFAAYYLLSPSYQAESIIILNTSYLTEPLRDAPPEGGWEKLATFHTQRDIITSERIATVAAKRTNLAANRVIGHLERIQMFIGDVKRVIGKKLGITRWTRPWSAEAAAIAAVSEGVETAVMPDSKAIKVSLRAKDPDEAARVLNALIEAHSEYYYGVIQDRAKGVVNYLQNEHQEATDRLRQAEAALFEFKQRDSLDQRGLRPDGEVRAGGSPSFVGITDSTEVQNEMKLYILKLEEEQRRAQQMVDLSKRERIIGDIQVRMKKYLNIVNSIPGRQLELVRLKREYDSAEDNYKLILRNLSQAKIVAGGDTDKIKLVDVFERAEPNDSVVFPQKKLMLLLSAFLGVVFALTWAFVLDFLDHTVHSALDIERHLRLRLLASVEHIR